MSGTEHAFAIVGAGPMGLAMARNCQKHGIPFVGFDMAESVGGLWDIDAPRSTMYESAHLISSKKMTEFKEYPMRSDVADYPHHSELKRYFNDFADHFDLRKDYEFRTEVVSAQREGEGKWKITTRCEGKELTRSFAGLMIANGTLSEPNMPSFKGDFSGELIHSSEYKRASQFDGKRVLIVGAGNSGCDIVVDAVHHAKRADLSVRRGYHFVPKYVFGQPADAFGGKITLPPLIKKKVDQLLLRWFVGDPQRLGFPEPDHELYESHPIVNSLVLYHLGHGDIKIQADIDHFDGHTVHFKDGTHEDYDMVMAATGYKLHYPFVDSALLNWKGAAPHLYLNCFHPEYDDLFLLGMVEASGLGWEGRYEQAELVARYVKALSEGSPSAARFKRQKQEPFPDMRGGMQYIKLDRMAYYVHKDTYRKAVLKHSKEMQ